MRCLLISPAFPETFWSFRHALRFIRRRAPFPPLGLLTIASMLPEEGPVRLWIYGYLFRKVALQRLWMCYPV